MREQGLALLLAGCEENGQATNDALCILRTYIRRLMSASVFSPDRGVESKVLVLNLAAILCERHYCVIDCCVLACVDLFGRNY